MPNMMKICGIFSSYSKKKPVAPVVSTTSVILSSKKIQNEERLVPANPDPSALKQTEEGGILP